MYRLTPFVAVKRARNGRDEEIDHVHEQKVFEILEKHDRIPFLIESFYRTPMNTFLELADQGSVALHLNRYQQRLGAQVLRVTDHLQPQTILRWMAQLCLAVAGLERIGLTHGDIRPHNMLLDNHCNLRLSDFDRAIGIGEDIIVLTEPFGRLLHHGENGISGTYGKAGARTENFAIGSVFYTLLRGHEPYETESWGRDHDVILIEKLQSKEFPPLDDTREDGIIQKCWNGGYSQVKELLAEFPQIEGHGKRIDDRTRSVRKRECEQWIESGLVDTLERY